MWLAPRPSVRESRVQIPSQHGNLVKFILVWVFFNPSGILTQTFTPPPTETRLLFNHGPQYGSAVCHHSRRSGRRPQQQNPTWEWRQHSWAEFPMMVIHHTHPPSLFTSFIDGAQAVAADAAQRPAWTPSTTYTQHSIFRSPDPNVHNVLSL